MKNRNYFICFTGIDGSGKTTLAKELVKMLNQNCVKFDYVYSRYVPSIILRSVMVLGKKFFFDQKDFFNDYTGYSNAKKTTIKNHSALADLYQKMLLCDYYIQIFFKIKLRLMFGKNIICDRYIYDTVVTDLSVDFNFTNSNVKCFIDKILKFFPTPDITFLIDLPEEIAFERKDDIPSINYLKDRRRTYLYLYNEYEIVKLDGLMPLSLLKKKINENLQEILIN